MIEMRIIDNGPMCRPEFQYRHYILGIDASGGFCPGNGWSEWKTAEWVKREETEND